MKNKQLIDKTVRLVESVTGKKVVFVEAPTTPPPPGTYGVNKNKSVAMTTKQIEKNPQEVERLAKKGFDLKVTDLRENMMDEQDPNYNPVMQPAADVIPNPIEDVSVEQTNSDLANTMETLVNCDILQMISDAVNQELLLDDQIPAVEPRQIEPTLDEADQSKLEVYNTDVEKMLKKMYDDNGGDWKKVSTDLQGAYQKIKDSSVAKQKDPLKPKF